MNQREDLNDPNNRRGIPASLPAVALSGSYNDLKDKPTLFNGDYNNLTSKPVIPAPQVAPDWNATSGVSQILNKPTIPSNTNELTNGAGFFKGLGAPVAKTVNTSYLTAKGGFLVGVENTNSGGLIFQVSADNVTWTTVCSQRSLSSAYPVGLSCPIPSNYYYKFVNTWGGTQVVYFMEFIV